MAPKMKQPKWCDPYVTGLLPLMGFIVGIVLCQIGVKMNNYVLDQTEWHCVRFDEGECTRFDRSLRPDDPPKVTRSDAK